MEHLQILDRVLKRLLVHKVQANKSQCVFLSDSIQYFGYQVHATGLHTAASKVQAI